MMTVLFAGNGRDVRETFFKSVNGKDFKFQSVGCVSSENMALERIREKAPDILVTTAQLSEGSGMGLIQYICDNKLPIQVLLVPEQEGLGCIQQLESSCDYISEKNHKRVTRLVKKAAQYIDKHYAEKISIDAIASDVYLSAGYLMTIFKREMGISIVSYLTKKRLDVAKTMLCETGMKIYEIAEKVGYTNATFFSTAFRKSEGVSPKQYRTAHLRTVQKKDGK